METMQTKICYFLFLIIFVVVECDAASGTGRTYGTWVDRRRERDCRRNLICSYRRADCMNFTPEKQWHCTAASNSIAAKKCDFKLCDKSKGMVCLEDPPPGNNMTEVDSNSCAFGRKCYLSSTSNDNATSGSTATTAAAASGDTTTAGSDSTTTVTATAGSMVPAGGTTTPDLTAANSSTTPSSATPAATATNDTTTTASIGVSDSTTNSTGISDSTTASTGTNDSTTSSMANQNATATIWTSATGANLTSTTP